MPVDRPGLQVNKYVAAGDCGGHGSKLSIEETGEKGTVPILNVVFFTLSCSYGLPTDLVVGTTV